MIFDAFIGFLRFSFYVLLLALIVMFFIKRDEVSDSMDNHNKYSSGITVFEKKHLEQEFYYELIVILLLTLIFFSVIKPPGWHLIERIFNSGEDVFGGLFGIDVEGMKSTNSMKDDTFSSKDLDLKF